MNESFSSCCAGIYELPLTRLLLGSSFHPGGLELTGSLARAVALGPSDRVLDVASGRGDTALHLASKYGAKVVGLDYSEGQVAEATERARKLGLADRVSFVRGDAQELPFDAETFDVVFCECALCTFPSRDKAVREVRRVLKRRGSFAVSDVVLNEPVPEALQGVFGHILCVGGALSQDGYCQALEDGGFSKVRFRDATSALLTMVEQIERRLATLATQQETRLQVSGSQGLQKTGLTEEQTRQTLHAGRSFIERGGLGYGVLTGRK